MNIVARIIVALGALTLATSASGETKAWQNPEVFRINKEPARSFFFSYDNADAAFSLTPWEQSNHKLLNGKWKFKWVESPSKHTDNFHALNFDDSNWGTMTVPGNWELNGYGTPFYHSHHCFKPNATPPEMNVYYNPVGSYRQNFAIPQSWQGQQIFLHFGAVKSAFYVWVNGEQVGYSQDSKTAAEFDITEYVKPGVNQLALQVFRYSDGSYFECQDMWRVSGIERDVYLYTTPKVRVQDYHAYTTLENDYRDGVLKFSANIENHLDSVSSGNTLKVELFDTDDNHILTKVLTVENLKAGKTAQVNFDAKLKNVQLWSAEQPRLYQLRLTLSDTDDDDTQHIGQFLGFRSSELKNGNILINGQPVYFKGVNRHEHDPVTGHVVSRESMLKDVEIMKQFNINAIRMSHYPNDPYIYHLADKYGLYIMDEANIESHGLGAANQKSGYDPSKHIVTQKNWQAAYIDRVSNMYERSKNTAAVVFRSPGNETGDGVNTEAAVAWLRQQEPDTPVISEQANLKAHTDAYGQMYASIPLIKRYATAEHDPARPVILIEYEHAMGNSLGNFQDYWETFEKYDALQGGFIWDWVDQTFAMTTLDGTPFWAYGGDLEPAAADTSASFCANGLIYADRSPYPYLWEVKKVHQNIGFSTEDIASGRIIVRNKNFFVSLLGYELEWTLTANGEAVANGSGIPLSAEPQQREAVQLDYGVEFDSDKEYFLNLEVTHSVQAPLLPLDHVVAWEQLLFSKPKTIASELGQAKLSLSDKSGFANLSGKHFSAIIDKKTGLFTSLKYYGVELLKASPRPDFYRAPTDNDLPISKYANGLRNWQKAGKSAKLQSILVDKTSSNTVSVKTEHLLSSIGSRYFTTYTVHGSGKVDVEVYFYAAPHARQSSLPRIGTLFQLGTRFDNVLWYGRGPHENYWDRKHSAHVGIYENNVEGLYVPYVRPQENGYRSDVRYVVFFNDDGIGIQFNGAPLIGFGAQRYNPDDYDANKQDLKRREMHPHDLKEQDRIYINIDYRQRGVGGTNSWGEEPLFDYTLPWLDYRYSYSFAPYKKEGS